MSASRPATTELATKEELKQFYKEVKELLTALKALKQKLKEVDPETKDDPKFIQINSFISQMEQISATESSPKTETRENIANATKYIHLLQEFGKAIVKHNPISELMGAKDYDLEDASNNLINQCKADAKKNQAAPSPSSAHTSMWRASESKQESKAKPASTSYFGR